MLEVPAYPKIFSLGSVGTSDALSGPVVVQEKIDGSFFGFGKNEAGELVARSRGKVLDLHNPDKMFNKAAEFVLSSSYLQMVVPDTYFYAEYLQKPKHNVLSYGRAPENNLVLFDAFIEGQFIDNRERLEIFADLLGIDVTPQMWFGAVTQEQLREFHARESVLGKELVEGVVIKNYGHVVNLYGQLMPLYTKFVRDAFKERHNIEWSTGDHGPKTGLKDYVADLISSVRSEARWRKAVLRGKEQELLEGSPRDIGYLAKYVAGDLIDEERENVKADLWRFVEKDLRKSATRGLAEWYKAQLAEDAFEPEGCDEVAA